MRKKISRVPKLCRHKARDLGYVTDPETKKAIYLGPWGAHETRRAYERWVADYIASHNVQHPLPRGEGTIKQLVEKYILFARDYYRKPGTRTVTSEYNCVRQALLELKNWFDVPCAEFKPSDLIAVRQQVINRKQVSQNGKPSSKQLSISTINAIVTRLKRMFKKGVEWEFVPAATWQALSCVSNLSWRTAPNLKDTAPIKPVDIEHVRAVMPYLKPKFQLMLETHLQTGMRVTELCSMRWREISKYNEALYAYKPTEHKTKHRGVDKVIFLRAELVERMRELPRRGASAENDFVFISWGRGKSKKYLGQVYPTGYRTAINRAIRFCNAALREQGKTEIPTWCPLQIRHSVATMVRQLHGLEAAQAMLGHASIEATQIYAEKRTELAAKIASKGIS
jgi:integrase